MYRYVWLFPLFISVISITASYGEIRWDRLEKNSPLSAVLQGKAPTITSMAFSPDGLFYATASDYGGVIRLCRTSDGAVIHSLAGTGPVAFASDGESLLYFALPRGGQAISLHRLSVSVMTVQNLYSFPKPSKIWGNFDEPADIAVSPAGDSVAIGSKWGFVYVVSLKTGALLRSFEMSTEKQRNAANSWEKRIWKVFYNADGSVLYCSINKELRVLDAVSGAVRDIKKASVVAVSRDRKMAAVDGGSSIMNLSTWRKISSTGFSAARAEFSSDGRHIAIGNGGFFRLFDVTSGKFLSMVKAGGGDMGIFSVPGTDDVAVSFGQDVGFWKFSTGEKLRGIENPVIASEYKVAMSPDGKRFAVAGGFPVETVSVFEMSDLSRSRYFSRDAGKILSLAFNPAGSKLIVTGSQEVDIWPIRGNLSASEAVIFPARDEQGIEISSCAVSPDATKLLCRKGGCLRLFSLPDMKERTVFSGLRDGRFSFTSSGRHAYAIVNYKELVCVDTVAGRVTGTVKLKSNGYQSCALDGDIVHVLNCGRFNIATASEVPASGEVLDADNRFDTHYIPERDSDSSPWFVRSAKNSDSGVALYDRKTGKLFKRFAGGGSSFALSPDGRYLISTGNSVRIWNVSTGASAGISVFGDEWLLYSDDGLFDGSKNCSDGIRIIKGVTVYGVDQFALQKNRPDLILERLGLGEAEVISYYRKLFQKRLAASGLKESDLEAGLNAPSAKILSAKRNGFTADVEFRLSDAVRGLRSYNVHVNEVPLFPEGKAVSGKSCSGKEKIRLCRGTNKIEVSCVNNGGIESYREPAYIVCDDDGTEPRIFFLGLGVSQYRDRTLSLGYADKDARDLAALFSRMKGYGVSEVFTKVIVNGEVTSSSIEQARTFFAAARPDDIAVLFIAGHGLHDRDGDSTYYYLTYGADLANLKADCIPFRDFEKLLQTVPSRNKLFLMDTCESGELDDADADSMIASASRGGFKSRAVRGLGVKESGSAKRPAARSYLLRKDRFIQQDLTRRSGAVVFSSSRGGEFSYEGGKVNNGFFTAKILEAFDGAKGDSNNDTDLSLYELEQYVSDTVADFSGNLQHPTVDRDNRFIRMNFPARGN